MCGGMSLWISGQAREFSRAEEAVEDQEDQSVGVVGSRGWNQSLAEGHETSQLVSSCLYLFASLCCLGVGFSNYLSTKTWSLAKSMWRR